MLLYEGKNDTDGHWRLAFFWAGAIFSSSCSLASSSAMSVILAPTGSVSSRCRFISRFCQLGSPESESKSTNFESKPAESRTWPMTVLLTHLSSSKTTKRPPPLTIRNRISISKNFQKIGFHTLLELSLVSSWINIATTTWFSRRSWIAMPPEIDDAPPPQHETTEKLDKIYPRFVIERLIPEYLNVICEFDRLVFPTEAWYVGKVARNHKNISSLTFFEIFPA